MVLGRTTPALCPGLLRFRDVNGNRRVPLPGRQPFDRPMISETGSRRLALESVAGLVVRRTQVVAVAGSCQTMVPVEPKWPNVSAEHVRPKAPGSRCQPRPKRGRSVPVWIARISRAVAVGNTSPPSGMRRLPGTSRDRARSRGRRPTVPRGSASRGCSSPNRSVRPPAPGTGRYPRSRRPPRPNDVCRMPQRVEDRPRHEARHRLAADLLDDRRRQQDAHALVADLLAGSEQQRRAAGSSHELRQGRVLAAKLGVLREHVGQARRVREQVMDRDGAAFAAAERPAGTSLTGSVSASSRRSRSHNTADAVIGLVGDAIRNGRSTRAAPKARDSAPGLPGGHAAPPPPRPRCPSARASTGSPPRNGWRESSLLRGERAFRRRSRAVMPGRRRPRQGSVGASDLPPPPMTRAITRGPR